MLENNNGQDRHDCQLTALLPNSPEKVDAGVVVDLAELCTPGELRLAELGAVRSAHRGRRRFLDVLAPSISPTTSAPAATGDSGEGADGAVHPLGLAQAILQETIERVLGSIGAAAIALGDATNSHAVEDGVGLVGLTAEDVARHDRGCGQRGCAAEKCSPGRSVVDSVLRHVLSSNSEYSSARSWGGPQKRTAAW